MVKQYMEGTTLSADQKSKGGGARWHFKSKCGFMITIKRAGKNTPFGLKNKTQLHLQILTSNIIARVTNKVAPNHFANKLRLRKAVGVGPPGGCS